MIRQHKNRLLLLPPAWIFGLIQRGRNILYDAGLLPSQKAALKTLVIGNIAVGGTGKTPHVIWLAKELSKSRKLVILSRGYMRKSKGFRWVSQEDHPDEAGDEPLEMKTSLPDIPIAVDANRLRALERIRKEINPPPDLVILDDGFQHRKLIPHKAIILSHYKRPFYNDLLMPAGLLREPVSSVRRADSIIVTNTEKGLDRKEKDEWLKHTRLKEEQLFNSSFSYTDLTPLSEKARSFSPRQADSILLVAGVAWPDSLLDELQPGKNTHMLRFRDHHSYTQKDVRSIINTFNHLDGTARILVTTGKDAMKLKYFPELQQLPMFCIGRQVVMTNEQKEKLIESILNNG